MKQKIIIEQTNSGMWTATKGKMVFVSPYAKCPKWKQPRHITIDDVVQYSSLEELAREIIVAETTQELAND